MAKNDSTSGIKFVLDDGKFLCPVTEASMAPRFNPGEFFVIDSDEVPEIGDDVFVRLKTGETMLRRLNALGDRITLTSYQDDQPVSIKKDEVSHCLYVAHWVTARDAGRFAPDTGPKHLLQ